MSAAQDIAAQVATVIADMEAAAEAWRARADTEQPGLGDIPAQVRAIEDRLRAHGVSINRFCRRIDINPSTWHRWKRRATEPQLRVWRRVLAEAASVAPEAAA